MNKKSLLIFGIGLVVTFLIFSHYQKSDLISFHITGQTMGKIIYNVKYVGQEMKGLKAEISKILVEFNQSLSTYIPTSEVSTLNKEGNLSFQSTYLLPILEKSKEIHKTTHGTFDPSIGALIQAWGFGSSEKILYLDSTMVDSLKQITGFSQISYNENGIELPDNFQLDFSAIAKGYAVDVIAELLESKNLKNYLIEIGGEVRCKGSNSEGTSWSLGIEDPTATQNEQKIMTIVRLKDRSLATSGNYRNYYKKNGKLYAHIIDPRTGYMAEQDLLSTSVFAKDCMTADAYATAFMVLGMELSKQIIESKDLDAILLYRAKGGQIRSYVSQGIKPFLEMNRAK